jgi:vesicle-associated membrane protein 7
MPNLLYSLVARGTGVLAENTEAGLQGNFASIAVVLLKKIAPEDARMSYTYQDYVFHYLVSNGLTVLTMCDREFPRLVAFRFLQKIHEEFLRMFSHRWTHAQAYAFNTDFRPVLDVNMKTFSKEKGDERIAMIQDQIGDIKLIMEDNISKVLSRGEQIEMLVDKSQQMEMSATKFHSSSKKLRRRMCCANAKWWIFLVVVLLAVIYLILAFACDGPALPKCHK